MIGPKQRRSKRKKHIRSRARRTKVIKKLAKSTQVTECNHCGSNKLSHRVCSHCGWYGGKQVITVATESSDNVLEA